jgi:hypothetical protein
MRFGTVTPPNYKLGQITPLSIQNQVNYPPKYPWAVLAPVLATVDTGLGQGGGVTG